jgi:hypothetical protein
VLPDVDAFATEVAHTITAAFAPVLERLAAVETRLLVLGDLRDRVVAVETKAAVPRPDPPAPVDVTPHILELRDRLITVETKAAERQDPIDLTPIAERMAAAEARLSVLGDLRDRLVTIETKAAMPVEAVDPPVLPDLTPLTHRVDRLETRATSVQDLVLSLDAKAASAADLGHVRERLAAVEVRPLLPGPAGKDGRDGVDGAHGKDGRDGLDGLGFDDLSVEHDGERGLLFRFKREGQVKEFPLSIPCAIYRGVFTEGKSYVVGDIVTWAGAAWHCQKVTASKPDDQNGGAWRLMVKRGAEGKPGRDGRDITPPPVVTVGGRR